MDLRPTVRTLLPALILSVAATIAVAPPASACIAEQPTFDQAIDGAVLVVDARVIAVREIVSEPDTYILAVDRVLKGQAGAQVVLEGPRTGLCGDDIQVDRLGQRIIIAVGIQFYDQVISPYWAEFEGQLGGTATTPFGARSLDDIARSIAPAPAAVGPATEADFNMWPLVAIVVVGLAFVLSTARKRWLRGRTRPDPQARFRGRRSLWTRTRASHALIGAEWAKRPVSLTPPQHHPRKGA